MNKHTICYILTYLMTFNTAFAAGVEQKFPTDSVTMGVGTSSASKVFTVNTNDGASNPKITVPMATKDFNFNKAVKIANDLLRVGNGTNTTTKVIEFDLGLGASNPKMNFNSVSGTYEFENGTIDAKGNLISLGDGTNTNKTLKFNKGANSPEIRYNSTTGKLQFSNDAALYKDIGSGGGGGGGINLLQDFNADFETGSPPQNWTASGGTFITETTNELFGLQSGSWDSNASSQTLSSQLVTIEKGFIGKKCTADIEYQWTSGVVGDLSFQVVDQVPNILATVNIEPTTGINTRRAFLSFDCPSVATDQLRVRLISNVANPALILIDNAFVGVGKSTVSISQAALVSQAYITNAVGCNWSVTNTVLSDFPAVAACPGPIFTFNDLGTAVTTDTDLPQITINSLPVGRYRATFSLNEYAGSVVASAIGLTDGTTTCSTGANNSGGVGDQMTISCVFEYTASGNRTFKLQGRADSGTKIIQNDDTGLNLYFWLERWPKPAEALNLETTGWFVDANIGGSNIVLGSALVSSYAEVTNATLDLVQRTGSAPVGIACSSGNASTVGSLTCSAGNETPGITFNAPYAGRYEVCANGYMVATGSGQAVAAWQLWEVPNSGSISLIQGGGQKQMVHGATGTNFDTGSSFLVCGSFDFASAGQKTIKMLRTQPSNVVSNFLLMADRDGSTGQRDVRFTVRPMNQNFPAPVFTEITDGLKSRAKFNTTPSVQIKHFVARLNSSCSVIQQAGNPFSSISNPSAGVCSMTLNGGYFSQPPMCVCSAETTDGAGRRYCAFDTTVHTSGFIRTRLTNETGAALGDTVSVSCWGE